MSDDQNISDILKDIFFLYRELDYTTKKRYDSSIDCESDYRAGDIEEDIENETYLSSIEDEVRKDIDENFERIKTILINKKD